jgi:hypothetical protein
MANEYKKMFPVEIDLCKDREVPDYSAESTGKGPSKPKMKTVMDCPTLYIRGVQGLDQIPEDGYVLVKIHRNSLTKRTPGEGSGGMVSSIGGSEGDKDGHDAELEIHEICLPAADGEADEEDDEDKDKGEFGDAMDKTAEKMGLKAKSKAPKGDEPADGGDEMTDY